MEQLKFRVRSVWLLAIFSAWTLFFFSLSSNQEYYTFPVWPTLFILLAAILAGIEEGRGSTEAPTANPTAQSPALFIVAHGRTGGVRSHRCGGRATLAWGLWDSRNLPYVADIGTLLAHRGVGDYTLSMSHFFDLTGPSFAALRLPAALAAITLLIGPALGWLLRLKGKHLAATVSIAITMTVFLIAAHIAFGRFEPMLSSKQFADTIMAEGHTRPTHSLLTKNSRMLRLWFSIRIASSTGSRQAGVAALRTARRRHAAAVGIVLSRCAGHLPLPTNNSHSSGAQANASGSSRRT